MSVSADRIILSTCERGRLESLVRAGSTEYRLVMRATIVLAADEVWSNTAIAAWVGAGVDTVRKWRRRWCRAPGLASLGDAKRSGRPPV